MKIKKSFKNLSFLNEELFRLHHLIKTKSTGTPQQLAEKLNCSEASVYRRLKVLKEDHGLPIEFCADRGCYYYDGDVSINFALIINGEEKAKIMGGAYTIKKIDFFSRLSKNESGMWEF